MTYYKEEMLENAIGCVCLVVFDDCRSEVGYLLETKNLSPKDRIGVHRSSKYCILPLNPRKGKHFFSLKHIQYVVYYNNRYVVPHNKREEKSYWKDGVKTDCLGQVINGGMSFDKFKMMIEEAYRE